MIAGSAFLRRQPWRHGRRSDRGRDRLSVREGWGRRSWPDSSIHRPDGRANEDSQWRAICGTIGYSAPESRDRLWRGRRDSAAFSGRGSRVGDVVAVSLNLPFPPAEIVCVPGFTVVAFQRRHGSVGSLDERRNLSGLGEPSRTGRLLLSGVCTQGRRRDDVCHTCLFLPSGAKGPAAPL